jgi:hypothetical protein
LFSPPPLLPTMLLLQPHDGAPCTWPRSPQGEAVASTAAPATNVAGGPALPFATARHDVAAPCNGAPYPCPRPRPRCFSSSTAPVGHDQCLAGGDSIRPREHRHRGLHTMLHQSAKLPHQSRGGTLANDGSANGQPNRWITVELLSLIRCALSLART